MDETPNEARPVPRSRARRIARIVGWSVVGLVIALVVAVGIGAWVLGREATLQRIVVAGEAALDGQLKIDGVTGSIYDRIAFERLVFRSKTQVITIEKGSLRYRLEPFARRFTVSDAHAAKLTIETIAQSTEPATEPDTLELPPAMRIDMLRLDAVHLDAIDLVNGTTRTSLGSVDLRARYAREGLVERWTVEQIAVVTPWGAARGTAAIDASKPFQLDARVTVEGQLDDVPYRAPLVVTGTLADLSAVSDFTVSDPSHAPLGGHADVHALPFRAQPIDDANLHVAGIAPQRWKADLPEADVTIDASIKPLASPLATGGTDPFVGTLHVVNASPGPIDRDRIPVASIDADVRGDSLAITIPRLSADLGAAGRLDGKADYVFADGGTASFAGAVRALDLRAIHGKLIASRFNGPVALSRRAGIVHLDTSLADIGRSAALRGELEGRQIRIAEAHIQLGGSLVDLAGRADLARDRPFELSGKLAHVDPHDVGDFTKADINAAFAVSGTIGATPTGHVPQVFRVAADVHVAPSRVAGRPLTGTIVGTVDGAIDADPAKGRPPVTIRQVSGAHIALEVGTNHVTADGDFGRTQDRLRVTADAPRLADFGFGLSGMFKGEGFLGGTLNEPAVDFTIAGDDLHYARAVATTSARTSSSMSTVPVKSTAMSLKSLRGKGRLLAGATGRLDADLAITEFRDGAPGASPAVQSADVRVEGTRDAHRLTLSASSDRFDFTTTAEGGLDAGNTWHGAVSQLQSRGRVPFALIGTTPLVVGAEHVDVGVAHLRFTEGEVDLERLTYTDGRLATAGRATGFPLSIIGTFSRDFSQRVATSLKFGGQWDLRIGETIDGHIRLARESGNIHFLVEPKIDVDPEKIEIDADIVADRITARIAADGRGLGRIDGSIDTKLSKRDGQWGLAGDAPLALTSDIDIPDLRWLGRLSGIPGMDVYGGVRLAVTAKGTVGRPSLNGHASADGIGIRWPDQGVNARDGKIDLDFEDDRIVLRTATLTAGDGHLDAHGELRVDDRRANGNLDIKFDKFEAVSRTDRTMIVSGTGSMKFGATGIDVTADVKADRGSLQLAERRGPTLSTDIVIVGRETDDAPTPPTTRVRFDVKFDMGDEFKVKGSGFDGKLGGTIRIAGTGSELRAIGTVAVRDGTYEGYGQNLTIDRGNLIFSGPIDNPALDIVAVRKNLAVEAGVQISGTALAPQAKLTSTPNVPDTEKLSWLVLGHGLAASNKSDYALLTSVAAGLLGSSDSTSIQSRIAATLGVDQIGVSGIGGDKGGLLTVGKQISSKLRVTFEQGLAKASTLVKLRYNIYPHIDAQVQAGSESGVDLFYTFSFD